MNINSEFKSNTTDVQVILLRTKDRSALVKRYAFQEDDAVWFPLSQVEVSDNGDGDRTHTLTAPDWLLKKEGWL
jgi:hypothetical protein